MKRGKWLRRQFGRLVGGERVDAFGRPHDPIDPEATSRAEADREAVHAFLLAVEDEQPADVWCADCAKPSSEVVNGEAYCADHALIASWKARDVPVVGHTPARFHQMGFHFKDAEREFVADRLLIKCGRCNWPLDGCHAVVNGVHIHASCVTSRDTDVRLEAYA